MVQTPPIVATSLVSSHHNHHMCTANRLPRECPHGPNIGGDNSCTPLHATSPPRPLPFHWTRARYTPSSRLGELSLILPIILLAMSPSSTHSRLFGDQRQVRRVLCHPSSTLPYSRCWPPNTVRHITHLTTLSTHSAPLPLPFLLWDEVHPYYELGGKARPDRQRRTHAASRNSNETKHVNDSEDGKRVRMAGIARRKPVPNWTEGSHSVSMVFLASPSRPSAWFCTRLLLFYNTRVLYSLVHNVIFASNLNLISKALKPSENPWKTGKISKRALFGITRKNYLLTWPIHDREWQTYGRYFFPVHS